MWKKTKQISIFDEDRIVEKQANQWLMKNDKNWLFRCGCSLLNKCSSSSRGCQLRIWNQVHA